MALPAEVPYLHIYLAFTLGVPLLHWALDFRQLKCCPQALRNKEPPPELASAAFKDPNLYKKTQAYSLDKWWFGLFHSMYSLCENVTVVLLGLIPWTWTAAGRALTHLPPGLAASLHLGPGASPMARELATSVLFMLAFSGAARLQQADAGPVHEGHADVHCPGPAHPAASSAGHHLHPAGGRAHDAPVPVAVCPGLLTLLHDSVPHPDPAAVQQVPASARGSLAHADRAAGRQPALPAEKAVHHASAARTATPTCTAGANTSASCCSTPSSPSAPLTRWWRCWRTNWRSL
ncbi:CAAX prenyl protease [Haematococcus lacustris]|uniref:CAAX prenyl protease n=1 Tax=Haematococcus lacustris TaxID=44745 RepID=A0A699ZIK7_HAELA|nr:CAAX prenyl protease [Haematococcus lacustris]